MNSGVILPGDGFYIVDTTDIIPRAPRCDTIRRAVLLNILSKYHVNADPNALRDGIKYIPRSSAYI